jgi:hypothetical protein
MTKKYDVKSVLDQMRVIHEEQTRRLVEQVLELRKLEERLVDEATEKEDTVDRLANLLRNLK